MLCACLYDGGVVQVQSKIQVLQNTGELTYILVATMCEKVSRVEEGNHVGSLGYFVVVEEEEDRGCCC